MNKASNIVRIVMILLLMTSSLMSFSQTVSLLDKIKSLPGVVSVEKIDNNRFFKETYVIMVEQYLDHKNIRAGKFKQRVILSHYNEYSPTVFVTEGYSADYALRKTYINELSRIIEANQIVVEHRYFGESKPEGNNWNYLSIENATADLHRVYTIFKQLYKSKWIATGISKGGQNTLAYKAFYPNDANIWISYVGPLNYAIEDPRMAKALTKIGSKQVRDKIQTFQLDVLRNRDKIQPLFDSIIAEKKYSFKVSNNQILDYCVLEYSFSFWQWGQYPYKIPEWKNNPAQMLQHLIEVSPPSYFDYKALKPFFVQVSRDFGYYSYDTKPFKDYLVIGSAKGYIKRLFLEPNEVFKYSNEATKAIESALEADSEHLIMIYGENDPWTAAAAKGGNGAKKFVIPRADHRIRIDNLTYEQKAKIYMLLENWLEE